MSFDSYSDRLKSARTAAGLSQGDLAGLAQIGGLDAPFISRIEHGALEAIVTALDTVLRERADQGDTVALAAWQQLPNVKSRSELAAELAAHPMRERQTA
jgi:transcriptional regulator with XRE-family HTH domain